MTYARAGFYLNREETIPLLLAHGSCTDGERTVFFGEQHIYAYCVYCNLKFVLLSNDSWEQLSKDSLWVGPAAHGRHE